MPTPLLIVLGVVAYLGLAFGVGSLIGRSFKLGEEAATEVHREFSEGGEDWC